MAGNSAHAPTAMTISALFHFRSAIADIMISLDIGFNVCGGDYLGEMEQAAIALYQPRVES